MSKMGQYVLGLIENGELDPEELDYPEPVLDEEELIQNIVDLQDEDDDIPF